MKILVIGLLAVAGIAHANEDLRLDWDPYVQTTCADGSPAAQCLVSGIEIQKKDAAGIWTIIGGVGVSTNFYVHKDQPPGEHCYRLRANSNGTFSVPSNVACKIVANPIPRPPVLKTVTTVAMSVKADWEKLAFVPSQAVGTVPLGTLCDATRSIGNGYYGVDRSAVEFSGANRPANIVAKCE